MNAILEKRKSRKTFCSVIPLSEGQKTIVESNFKDLGAVTIKESEIST